MGKLMKYHDTQDGILAWIDILEACDKGGSKALRTDHLEDIVNTSYNRHYKGGLTAYLNDYEAAITELATILKVEEWKSEATPKRKLITNLEPLRWKWLHGLTKNMSLPETYLLLREIGLKDDRNHRNNNATTTMNRLATAQLARIEKEVWDKLPRVTFSRIE